MLNFIFGNPEKEKRQHAQAEVSRITIADAEMTLSNAKCALKEGLGYPLTWLGLGTTSHDLAALAKAMKVLNKRVEPLTDIYQLELSSSGVVTINSIEKAY